MYHHCHPSAPDIATIIVIDFGNGDIDIQWSLILILPFGKKLVAGKKPGKLKHVVLDLVCFLNLLQMLKLENIGG